MFRLGITNSMLESEGDVSNPVAFPRLSDAQLERLRSYGPPQTVEAGDVLYRPGDATYDLIVTADATVDIIQPEVRDAPEEPLLPLAPTSLLVQLHPLPALS